MKPLLLVLILLVAASAVANDFYVATTGNDANPGTSASPWQHIEHAISIAVAGDTVNVKTGTYNVSPLTISHSGTSGAPVTFTSVDGRGTAKVVISNGDGIWGECWTVAASWVVIDGFDITEGSTTCGRALLSNTSGSNVTFKNNRVHDLQKGQTVSTCDGNAGGAGIESNPGASNLNLLANEVFNIGNYNASVSSCTYIHGIYSNSSGQIKNNLIFRNAGFGINSHASNQDIVNNTIFNQNAGGIFISGGTSGHHINNNVIYNVGIGNSGNQCGVNSQYSGDSSSNSAYTDNLIFQSSGTQANNWCVSSAFYTGYLNLNPLFVNYTGTQTGDYHLQSGSPAIQAGTTNLAPATDFAGVTRTAPIWIGIYQSNTGTIGGTAPAAPTGLTAMVQ